MHDGSNRLGEVYFALCKSLDTPRSLACWLLYQSGEHKQLAELEIQPKDFRNAESFHKDYIVTSYLSKYKGLDTGLDLKAVALGKFSQSEDRCAELNKRILSGEPLKHGADAVIMTAARKISSLLGSFSFSKVLDGCRWGPGATSSLSAREATLDNKVLEKELSVTLHALPYFKALVSDDIHWLRARGIDADGPCCLLSNEFAVVQGGRLAVVPKSAKTDRTILVEPTGNLFLQFGVGSFIRSRLRTVGVDLNSQELNRELARQGYATIDLKAASDSVFHELVYQLLPFEWAEYLDRIRSKSFTLDGCSYHKLHKFSSMGNGFTFELESLFFWALSKSVMDLAGERGCCSVFGDDIVVPTGVGQDVVDVLEAIGFQTNHEKTFIDGPFRESCGSHWFEGTDVTPCYQKEIIISEDEVYRAGNRLIRLGLRRRSDGSRCSLVRNALRALIRTSESMIRCAQPVHDEADDGLICFSDDPLWLQNLSNRRLIQLPVRKKACNKALLALTLRFGCLTNNQAVGVHEWVFTLPYNGHVSVRSGGAYVHRRRQRSFWSMSDAPWS